MTQVPSSAAVLASVCGILGGCASPGSLQVREPAVFSDTATVQVNGTRLFYETAGTGPAVVLLHAGNLDRRMWDAQMTALARDHRVIRYDSRGYGRSGAADAPYRGDEDLYALLIALKVPRVSLIGASLGGRIAIDFALAHPEMVDRLILAAPGLSGWKFQHLDTTWLPVARQARSRGDSAGIALAWLRQDFMRAAMERPQLATTLQGIAAENGRFWMEFIRYGGEADLQGDPPALNRTHLIQAPTLLIMGTREARDMREIADTLAATITNLRRVTFDGAGHLPSLEQPAKFARIVREFLQ